MGSLPRTLELFYDVVSPYSWLGFEVLCRYQHLWNVDLQLRPSYLPGILKDSGNTGPSLVPRKLLYMVSDLRQLGRHLQVPIHTSMDLMSAVFQRGSLSAMRFLTAVHLELPEKLEQVSRQLWIHTWSLNKDITEPGSILAAAREAGMSADQAQGILEKISTPRVKDQLRETTQAACNYGGFGLPITVAHVDGQTHMLFGSDRMELLAYLLGEKWMGPVPPAPNSRM